MAILRNELSAARFGGCRATTRRSLVIATLVVPALLLGSCGGGGGGGGAGGVEAAEVLVAPFIRFSFEGVRERSGTRQTVQLNMVSDDIDQGKPSGTITATLSIRDALSSTSETSVSDLAGTYSGNSLRFKYAGAGESPLAYSGQFVEPDVMVLTPSAGVEPAVTLLRADLSFRPKLHDSSWSGTDAATGQIWKVHFETEPKFNDDSTEFFKGAGTIGGDSLTVRGYAAMRRIEIDITRGTQTTRRLGRMGPAGQTPPASVSTPAQAQTMTFSDGGTLTRDVGVTPP